MTRSILVVTALVLGGCMAGARAEEPRAVAPYVFTDGAATIAVPGASGTAAYRVRTVTVHGWGPVREVQAPVRDGMLELAPLQEGIHIVTLPGMSADAEARFLALDPPEPPDTAALTRALPRSSARLLSGRPFRIVAMGDSVTATGDYESLLAMMLMRVTGNTNITVVTRAYPGRSVDASVREFERDAVANRPDLGLIMYGLNDQGAGSTLEVYLAQYRWLAEHLASECGADTVFMQPTPVFYLSVFGIENRDPPDVPWSILRTLRFAHALRGLGAERGVPVAETFDALWGTGGPTLEDSARAMWPCFPPHHSRRLHSLLESDGKGDAIHPNALGHLQLARAVYQAIAGDAIATRGSAASPTRARPVHERDSSESGEPASPLDCRGETRWTDHGPVSTVTVVNRGDRTRRGLLKAYPPTDAALLMDPAGCYELAPGASRQFEVRWPEVAGPEDLLTYPYNRYLGRATPLIPLVDVAGCGSRVYAVEAPFECPVHIERGRFTVTNRRVMVSCRAGGRTWNRVVAIPPEPPVGRAPVIEAASQDGLRGWGAAQVAYVRYGAALPGEAVLDGRLDEWAAHRWEPVGLPVQARSRRGQTQDARHSPDDVFMHWAFKAGTNAVFMAAQIQGDASRDRVSLFFDPRPPAALGTVGRYYWAWARGRRPMFQHNGRLALDKGETTPASARSPRGAWTRDGGRTTLEIEVPYTIMETDAWPASGDLGVSIVWHHYDEEGALTRLCWSESGHEWTPRRYGVVRRAESAPPAQTAWPYLVHVE